MKQSKDKKLIIALVISLVVFFLLSYIAYTVISCNLCLNETLDFANKNEKTIFSIDNCTFFSSADTKNKSSSITNFTIENLYQFTDIALYINNHSDENYTMENTLKELSITNINFTKKPEIGEPSLYYKNLNDFSKSNLVEENKIDNELVFNVSSESELDFENPSIYNNCASPIVLSFVNSNIKTDYTFTDTSTPITYDGSLLKKLDIPLESLETKISFDINIVNNLDERFKTTVYLDIPFKSKDNSTSILDGKYIEKTVQTNMKFYKM